MAEKVSRIANATPILKVKDFEASLAYYTEKLGFKVDWKVGTFGSVTRDRCSLMLTEDAQGHAGTWLWIGAQDVELLFAEWSQSGAMIRQGPTNFPWGSLEIQVTDPDGHVLRFGSDGIEGMAMGPWMDAEGKLWPMGASEVE
jgi:uncharacterized glyoxalase superfamily protein PhnB